MTEHDEIILGNHYAHYGQLCATGDSYEKPATTDERKRGFESMLGDMKQKITGMFKR